ncbi:ABC transporter ATP-binding protein [Paenibacillus sp. LHD-117]|uniref:ABC transporter ATP-binding protein n=1 Tax=Paenibacillus sp. LHD-117 TaxID=3071412 RepID=UPI0027E00E06|nr:ABC transporter ATP-binding protein [Paenibacillus sp. LHD-117]MDQ6419137.1 ABC transporter ATP-binding protein [Paenibacillus sp. LHD-117]
MTKLAVQMTGIVKKFGEVVANDHVDFAVRAGEIHALLGENGAGKSTVMSLLSGLYRADAGGIAVHGTSSSIASPKDAMKLGIGMVHQNFRLVPTLTALENIILGERGEPWRGNAWKKRKLAQVDGICERYGLRIPLGQPVWALSVGEQQRVEIVKTLYRGADIILLDEPTSVLTPGEAEALFQTMRELKDTGKTMIITTHKLKEVMAVADRISVMRKGRMIASMDAGETDARNLAELMVGREIREREAAESGHAGETILEVSGMTVRSDHGHDALANVAFRIREGEIVGVAGVAGNGQKELAEALTGLRGWTKGSMLLQGERMENAGVRRLIDRGVAHIPEDRMKSGLAGSLGVVDNLMLKTYRTGKHFRFGLLRNRANVAWGKGLAERFDVRYAELGSPARQMSGGNQQKLLLAREIDQQPKLMVAVHPTQGLDVGAAESVHQMLLGLRDASAGVLLISEDLDEVLLLSDRVFVLYGGRIIGELPKAEADKERIGRMMAGLEDAEVAAQ